MNDEHLELISETCKLPTNEKSTFKMQQAILALRQVMVRNDERRSSESSTAMMCSEERRSSGSSTASDLRPGLAYVEAEERRSSTDAKLLPGLRARQQDSQTPGLSHIPFGHGSCSRCGRLFFAPWSTTMKPLVWKSTADRRAAAGNTLQPDAGRSLGFPEASGPSSDLIAAST